MLRSRMMRVMATAMVLMIARASGAEVVSDLWYSVLLEDQPSGHMHERITQSDGLVTESQALQVTIRRGQIELTVEFTSEFVETSEGKPVSAMVKQKLGALQPTVQRWRFTDEGMEMVSESGGQEFTTKLAKPTVSWLTPTQARERVRKELAQGTKEMSFWVLEPAMGPHPIELKMLITGREMIEVMGKVVPAIGVEVSYSMMPGVSMLVYVDDDGDMLQGEMGMIPGFNLTLVRTDKQIATAAKSPPELMATTLVHPDRAIANPRGLSRAVYELTFSAAAEAMKGALPDGGVQRVTWTEAQRARVEVDLNRAEELSARPGDEWLRATVALNSEDEAIRRLLNKTLGEQAERLTASEKAERLRLFVHHYIEEKDLSVGFATASEVARTAQGDCTEHAVLLAALLRAAGIPSRTVSGLVYVDEFLGAQGVFGYHMWTQGWLAEESGAQGRWVDLDATLSVRAFDAAHITLSRSAMADEEMMNDLIRLGPIIGRLSIRVVETGGR